MYIHVDENIDGNLFVRQVHLANVYIRFVTFVHGTILILNVTRKRVCKYKTIPVRFTLGKHLYCSECNFMNFEYSVHRNKFGDALQNDF